MADFINLLSVCIALIALALSFYNSYYLWLQSKERLSIFPSVTFVDSCGVRNIISLKHLKRCPQENRKSYGRRGLLTMQLVNKSCFDVEIFAFGLSRNNDVCRIGIFEPVFVYGSVKTEDLCDNALVLPFKMKRGESVVFALHDEDIKKAIRLKAYRFQVRTSRNTRKEVSIEKLLLLKSHESPSADSDKKLTTIK